jgi:hypothetical protein
MREVDDRTHDHAQRGDVSVERVAAGRRQARPDAPGRGR